MKSAADIKGESEFNTRKNKSIIKRNNFILSIKTINKSINNESILEYGTIQQINIICTLFVRKIYHSCLETLHNVGQKTIEKQTVKKAIIEICGENSMSYSKNIFNNAIDVAMYLYQQNRNNKKKGERLSNANAAEIMVSPSIITTYLKMQNSKENNYQSKYEVRISKEAKISVAAFINELLRLICINCSKTSKKINSRDLLLSIDNDICLKKLFEHNKIYLLEAGVIPYQSTKKTKKKISLLQSDIDNTLPYKPTKKIVKDIFSSNGKEYRADKYAINDLINFIELKLIELMRKAIDISKVSSNKISLNPLILLEMA